MSDKKPSQRKKNLAYCKMFGCDFKEIIVDKAIDKIHCDQRLIEYKVVSCCLRCYVLKQASFFDYCFDCVSIITVHYNMKTVDLSLFDHANDNDRLEELFDIVKKYRSMSNKY